MVLKLQREPANPYDPNAIKVVAPDADQMTSLLEDFTRDHHPKQQVKEVVGQTIGRVPKGVNDVIASGIDSGWVTRAVCFHVGGFRHNKRGPQLKCCYVVYVDQSIKPITQIVQMLKAEANLEKPELDITY